ncbi:MAG: sigma-70 family RNA polymerase sigma factor [Planctomycetota bacterium]|nr:MAG: sigma-70 family RNA polymerase sigma factor [Planctomycetota bacterium]
MTSISPPGEGFLADACAAHAQRLLAVARRILGSEDLAWDAVQEALLALWMLRQAPPSPRAWLLRAVVHRSLHLRRGLQRRRRNEELALAACPLCTPEEPLHVLENADLRAALAQALEVLSSEQRVVFLLYEVHGLDYAAIAAQRRVAIGTVRSRLSRARAALQAELARRDLDLAAEPARKALVA